MGTAADILLTGVYPALTWVTYLLVGMLAARWLLRARARGRERSALGCLCAVGVAALAAGTVASELAVQALGPQVMPGEPELWRAALLANGYGAAPEPGLWWQLLAAPHTGTVSDILRTAGLAVAVIGLLGLLVSALPARALRWIEPLRVAGAAPLTLYVVHLLALTIVVVAAAQTALSTGAEGLPGGVSWLIQVAIALAIGALLWLLRARGPLERVVGWIVDAVVPPRAPARIPHRGSTWGTRRVGSRHGDGAALAPDRDAPRLDQQEEP